MDRFSEIERELEQARLRDDNAARARLIPRVLELPEAEPHRADYLDELSYAYQELGRFDEAISAMREAVAAGWDGTLDEYPSAQALIGGLLLRAGHTDEAEQAWLQAERERPDNPWVHLTAGIAYLEAGLHEMALSWQTKGLQLALDANAPLDMIDHLAQERGETLGEFGRAPDALQERADTHLRIAARERFDPNIFPDSETARAHVSQNQTVAAGWFPADQYERALDIWPTYADAHKGEPHAEHCGRLERVLKGLKRQGITQLAIAPIMIGAYLPWCADHDADPETSEGRSRYAATLIEGGAIRPWPPERNQPCWCGSGRKYKKCCHLIE